MEESLTNEPLCKTGMFDKINERIAKGSFCNADCREVKNHGLFTSEALVKGILKLPEPWNVTRRKANKDLGRHLTCDPVHKTSTFL